MGSPSPSAARASGVAKTTVYRRWDSKGALVAAALLDRLGDLPGVTDLTVELGKRATADEINAAYDRVVGSDVRYRFVIDTATLAD